MENKIILNDVLNKYIIIETTKKHINICYDIDDSKIMWIHNRNLKCFACISNSSFFNSEADAKKAIEKLKDYYFAEPFIKKLSVIKVFALENLSNKSFVNIVSDISNHNRKVDMNREAELKRIMNDEFSDDEIEHNY